MEQKLLVASCENELIHKLSKALIDQGITEGADCYYVDDEFNLPFFKIPKRYKKEKESDPDVHYAFIDVDDNPPFLGKEEYTVHGNYHHNHFSNADDAAALVKKLLTGEVCEVALILNDAKAGFFVKNTGDPQKNVSTLLDELEFIMKQIKGARQGGHHHMIFKPSSPYYLFYGLGKQNMFDGYNAYAVSSVLAVHPEFYILG